jgi:hypothetical protein
MTQIPADLRAALAYLKQAGALGAARPGHPDNAGWTIASAETLASAHSVWRDAGHLDTAVGLLRGLEQRTPRDAPLRPTVRASR